MHERCIMHQFGTKTALSMCLLGRILGWKLSTETGRTNTSTKPCCNGSNFSLSPSILEWAFLFKIKQLHRRVVDHFIIFITSFHSYHSIFHTSLHFISLSKSIISCLVFRFMCSLIINYFFESFCEIEAEFFNRIKCGNIFFRVHAVAANRLAIQNVTNLIRLNFVYAFLVCVLF